MTREHKKLAQRDRKTGRTFIDGPEDIPVFASDEEELEFWRTHKPSPKFWKAAKPMSPEEILRSANELPQR